MTRRTPSSPRSPAQKTHLWCGRSGFAGDSSAAARPGSQVGCTVLRLNLESLGGEVSLGPSPGLRVTTPQASVRQGALGSRILDSLRDSQVCLGQAPVSTR